jgi:hypothetical protein
MNFSLEISFMQGAMSAAEPPTPKSLTTVKEVGFSFNSPIFLLVLRWV